MSLSDFLEDEDVRELIDDYFKKPRFTGGLPIKAAPLTTNYSTVGQAFDYVARLYVSKLNKWCNAKFPLVAEQGVNGKRKREQFIDDFNIRRELFLNDKLTLNDLLPDCITLAKLDTVFRSGQDFSDSEIFFIDNRDIIDLNNLVKLIKDEDFKAHKQCILNPHFGMSGHDIGGADADLIIDSMLIDIKTTKELKFRRDQFRQLIGYYVLNIREHEINGTIKESAIYFSRYGYLFSFPVPELEIEDDVIPFDTEVPHELWSLDTEERCDFWEEWERELVYYQKYVLKNYDSLAKPHSY